MAAKRIGSSSIIGEMGIAHIRRVVLEMGFMFYETGGVEAGIDGFIELRDETTGQVGNLILQVQGKATKSRFPKETDQGFEWPCHGDDISYWLQGTAPVLLIIVRTTEDVAYWKSITHYFRDPQALQSRRVVFDKRRDEFTKSARSALIELAAGTRAGAIAPPARIAERLVLNLLSVERLSPRLYLAETAHKDNQAFGAALRTFETASKGEWIVKGGRVLSFHDLDTWPWSRVCDPGTIEDFPTEEWALSDDADQTRDFVQLLNRALNELTRNDLRFDKTRGCYFFKRIPNRPRRPHSYRGFSQGSSRNVVRQYTKKKLPSEHAYFRHSAFEGHFLRLEYKWYLEVTPTYYFTRNGYEPDRFYSERLKKIKEIENNGAVSGQFQMWRHYLTHSGRGDMLAPEYPFLKLGQLEDFTLDHGVPDELWRAQEPRERATLFDEDTSEP